MVPCILGIPLNMIIFPLCTCRNIDTTCHDSWMPFSCRGLCVTPPSYRELRLQPMETTGGRSPSKPFRPFQAEGSDQRHGHLPQERTHLRLSDEAQFSD